MSHAYTFFMHTFFLLFPFSKHVLCFLLFFLSLSQIDYVMAPKQCKSTPAWNPHQGSKSSSSSNPPVPFHIRFRDEKAKTNFADTPLPKVIRTQGWESLLKRPTRCPIMFIQEFYSNIHDIDTSVPQFVTTFRGTHIVVTLDLISELLHVPRVAHHDYPGYDQLRTMSIDELISHFC